MPRPLDIPVIVAKIEAVRNWDTVVNFSRKGAGGIPLIVCQILRQRIVPFEIETTA